MTHFTTLCSKQYFYLFYLFVSVSAHNSVYARQNNLLAIFYVHYTHLGLAHPMILYIIKMYQCITAALYTINLYATQQRKHSQLYIFKHTENMGCSIIQYPRNNIYVYKQASKHIFMSATCMLDDHHDDDDVAYLLLFVHQI